LSGGTTILCKFFTNFLRESEKSQLVTIRLQKDVDNFHVCDIDMEGKKFDEANDVKSYTLKDILQMFNNYY
jgi:hypothetical protein